MTDLASQFAAAAGQAMGLLAVPAVYTRVDTKEALDLMVAPAVPDDIMTSGTGALLAAQTWDMVVETADLVFGGAVYMPSPGDTILISSGGIDTTYVALAQDGSHDCWCWADRFKVRRQVHVTLVSTANTPT